MQALNHVAFGSLIAVTIKQPSLAAPMALASHFVLDTFPHYGEDPRARQGSLAYNIRIVLDASLSLVLLIGLAWQFPQHTSLILLCGFLAILPDFFWPLALYIKQRGPIWAFLKFHKSIQKFESPRGIWFEVIWLLAILFCIKMISI